MVTVQLGIELTDEEVENLAAFLRADRRGAGRGATGSWLIRPTCK